MTPKYHEKVYELDYDSMINLMKNQGSVYLVNIHSVCAKKLTENLTYIDKNGLKLIGIIGDYRVLDTNGLIYYMNKHLFNCRYTPIDINGFNFIKK